MNCPRCGKPLAAGASFCMHCGQALAAPRPPTPTQSFQGAAATTTGIPLTQAFDAQRKRNRAIAVVAVLLAIVAALLGLKYMGALGMGAGRTDSNGLQARGSLGPSTLKEVGNAGPPVLQKDETRIVMPDDIYKWLEHLHQTEIKRVAMTNGQITQGMVEKEKLSVNGGVDAVKDALNGIDDPSSELHSPVDSIAKMIKKMHDDSADLQKFFDSYPAPEECVPIQAAYDQALGETTSELGDLADHLAAGDINKLQSMKGVSTGGIDSAGAKTDRLVGEICDKYNTKKWFSITKDIAPGGVFAMPGF